MSTGKKTVNVFERANDLLMTVAQVVAVKGDEGAFWQSFDAAPDDETKEAEFTQERLNRTAARKVLQERVEGGFVGLLGFCCPEPEPPRLYVEVFDTRAPDAAPGTAKSIALSLPFKKTWSGKYRFASSGTLHGDPAPLND